MGVGMIVTSEGTRAATGIIAAMDVVTTAAVTVVLVVAMDPVTIAAITVVLVVAMERRGCRRGRRSSRGEGFGSSCTIMIARLEIARYVFVVELLRA